MASGVFATSKTPALVIYLLDVSASMTLPLGQRRRIDIVTDALRETLKQMVFRSTRGIVLSPRYRVAMYAYSDKVHDLLPGVQTVEDVAHLGVPELTPTMTTDTAAAFLEAEALLRTQIPQLQDCPAPLVCHLTDGEYTGADPEKVARRIMDLRVADGPVLVENIFISESVLAEPVRDPKAWPGILASTRLKTDYARKLRAMSSPLPGHYRTWLGEYGYHLAPGALMMLPGTSPDLVSLGFHMSSGTR